ncbi:unnamed protein product [Adineta steineri]|uniref:Uncharacterized protein n=1 Tax=Adineta steineri TaxID=433720 RepID=A0A819ZCI5_9BILA|nr:unnamed protein product [Adineta steineri]CAF4168738.1 unnamed protein product [Adineta steineri]
MRFIFIFAKVETVADTINDLVSILNLIRREQDEKKKEQFNGGEYFVSVNLILADLTFFDTGETLLQLDAKNLNNHP